MVAAAPTKLREQALQARLLRFRLARADPNTFAECVMKDELTGKPIRQAPVHEAWHELMSANRRLLIWSHVESGKTQQVGIARVLWELGRNPNLRILILSNTAGQAKKISRALRSYIEYSEELKLIFPHLKKGEPWGEQRFSVQREVISKDPTVQVAGVHGNVTGSRLDLVIMDDVLDYENTRTPAARNDLDDWYKATVAGRLLDEAKVYCIGTAYHPDDFLHRLARRTAWQAMRYPVLHPDTNEPRWPERWPMRRIQEWREEHGPIEFARQLLCQARDDTTARFKKAWIEKCLARGNGRSMASALKTTPTGYRVFTGVDLAVQQHNAADLTALFSIAIDPQGNRHVLEIRSGRWTGPEIIEEIRSAHVRYNSIVVVENNAAQDFIVQFLRHRNAIPIKPFTTGRNKAHPDWGIESLGPELDAGKWIIPNQDGVCHPEVQAWIDEMLYYDPKGHTGDRLMASWFAREGHRMGTIKAEQGSLDFLSR